MKLITPFVLFIIFALLLSSFIFYDAENTNAAVASWQRGASIVPVSQEDFGSSSFKQSLNDLKSSNANSVTLIIPYYQTSTNSTDIYRGWNTPTDASLISGIQYARSLGLNVILKPHMETSDGQWRAHINPSNREAWFSEYGGLLEHYAGIGEQYGVTQIVLGSELISMASEAVNPSNTQHWINIIQSVRSIFSGTLTYSANWGPPGHWFVDEKNHIGFWSHLDYIGIAAYYQLNSSWGQNDVESLRQGWGGWDRSDITPLSQKHNKPILFTEIGYRSVDGAHTDPWDSGRAGGFNEVEQTNAYEALFSYWNDSNIVKGVSLWDWKSWPDAGGAGNTDYTPQNKEAQNVMSRWFAGATGDGDNGGDIGTTIPHDFEISGSADSTTITKGGSIEFIVNVSPVGANANNVTVDIELYDSAGAQMLQEVYTGQNIPEGTTQTYAVNQNFPNEGEFVLKTGVFSSDWSTLHKWNNEVVRVSVVGESDEAPPSDDNDTNSEQIEIWWPTDGSVVSGTQPFKGMLRDLSLDQYNMFWQVDGDRLNEMHDSQEDYPHKEAWVDLSGWSWRTDGSAYVLNFVAKTKDLGGEIANKVVNIFVNK